MHRSAVSDSSLWTVLGCTSQAWLLEMERITEDEVHAGRLQQLTEKLTPQLPEFLKVHSGRSAEKEAERSMKCVVY